MFTEKAAVKSILSALTILTLTTWMSAVHAGGALAIDSNQRKKWGWAIDYPDIGQAEQRALSECGEKCTVVKTFTSGCAAYAADQTGGATAYGWGTAPTGPAAQSRAMSECQSRNSSSRCTVRSWGCNKPQFNSTERFKDNGDGTITDTKNGLIGLKNANCLGKKYWEDAKTAVEGLASGSCGLSDGSKPGDWRLPAMEELPLFQEWRKGGAFTITQFDNYWSNDRYKGEMWEVRLDAREKRGVCASPGDKYRFNVWPVRGKQAVPTGTPTDC